MKTCISWTKVSTNVIFHDHEAEEVLFFRYMTFKWPDVTFADTKCIGILQMKFIVIVMIKKRQAFSKIWLWRHQLLTWLNRQLTRTPIFCSDKNLSLVRL